MSDVYLRGQVATLVVRWREYAPNGPLVNVNSTQITITALAGGGPVVGPTSVGITNPAVGVEVFNYAVPDALAVGDYLVTWDAEDPGTGNPIQASEIITIASTLTGSSPGGPCEVWPATFTCALPTGSEAVSGVALEAATETLYALSGRQFGLCTVTTRPCRRECYGEVWPFADWLTWGTYTWPRPTLYAGEWFNLVCGDCGGGCGCGTISEALLPGPVHDVLQVKVDGVPLVRNVDYRLDDWRVLVRLGGERWPECNDLTLADTQVGTWSATFRTGSDVPNLGRLAVGVLAVEFMKLMLCDDTCSLPRPIQSLARQGVNITFLDPNEVFQNGRIGLYLPDTFIQTYNPRGLQRRSRAYDVDGSVVSRRQFGTG